MRILQGQAVIKVVEKKSNNRQFKGKQESKDV